MKVLFFANPSMFHTAFIQRQPPGQSVEMACIRHLSAELLERGFEPVFFDAREHRLIDFKLVHIFGEAEPETWRSIREYGCKVIVTPGLGAELGAPEGLTAHMVRLMRGLTQRRWPPIDERWFRDLASGWFRFGGANEADEVIALYKRALES